MGISTAHQQPAIVARSRFGRFRRPIRRGLFLAVLVILFTFLFYAEENHRGPKKWERCRAQLLAKGVPLDWHKLAPPNVANEENFASTPFLAALYDFAPGTYTPRDLNAYNAVAGFAQFEEPYAEARRTTEVLAPINLGDRVNLTDALRQIQTLRNSGPKQGTNSVVESPEGRLQAAAQLLQALEPLRPVLDELQRACARPQSRFNLNYGEQFAWDVPQPHLPVLERVSRVLAWRGCSELALQTPAAAAEDATFILDLAFTLGGEPFRSSLFTRNAMIENARQILWEGLASHQWSKGQLQDLQARFQKISLRAFRAQLQIERMTGNDFFEMIHQRPAIVNGWTFGPSLKDKARGFILRNMPAGWMYLEQAAYQSRFDECVVPAFNLETGRINPNKLKQVTRPGFALAHHRLVADLVLFSANYLCSRGALAQTGVDQAVIACALESYWLDKGKFPSTLDDLGPQGLPSPPVDVITGGQMNYHLTTGGGFVLYSVGWNEKDDGGKIVLNSETKVPDSDQGDWVWPAYPQ